MTVSVSDFARFDATDLAEQIRRKNISASEVLEASIAAIEVLNPRLNAVVCKLYAQARDQLAGSMPKAPLYGVPFLAKDLFVEIAGTPLSEGSAFLRDRHTSMEDSELVTRWREAGLVLVGKTNTPEFGMKPDCEPNIFGCSINPWAPERTTGGSSGGSAAAVAARLVPMAHANDAGGSIRIPASCCGLFGLKPTRARNPLGPLYGDAGSGIVSEHAITRSVRDSALLLDLTSRLNAGEPYYAPKPETTFVAATERDPRPLRVGLVIDGGGETATDNDCIDACRKAAALLSDLGHFVEDAKFTHDAVAYHRRCVHIFASIANWAVKDWARRLGKSISEAYFEPFTWFLYERGQKITSGDHLLIVQDMQRHTRDIVRFFDRYDVMLTPTMMVPPPPLGYLHADKTTISQAAQRMMSYTFYCFIANGAGLPSASLPLHWNDEGLPIGVLVTGRYGSEELLFSLAAQLERATSWSANAPKISVL